MIHVGDEVFSSVEALHTYAQNLLRRAPLNTPVGATQERFLRALVRRHPEYETRGMAKAAGFVAMLAPAYATKCFGIIKPNGKWEDFSLRACTYRTAQSTRHVKDALRRATSFDMASILTLFRSTDPATFICPLSQEEVPKAEASVDHVIPFSTIVDGFVKDNAITLDDIPIKWKDDVVTIADDAIKQHWLEYHNAHARVHLVSIRANKARGTAPITHTGLTIRELYASLL